MKGKGTEGKVIWEGQCRERPGTENNITPHNFTLGLTNSLWTVMSQYVSYHLSYNMQTLLLIWQDMRSNQTVAFPNHYELLI